MDAFFFKSFCEDLCEVSHVPVLLSYAGMCAFDHHMFACVVRCVYLFRCLHVCPDVCSSIPTYISPNNTIQTPLL